uniref:Protein suppressor of white apricotlike [Bombyx mori] n=1 Tax=Lepeophtheirus salmonis TaxID=72036 RepID=A0A0K2V9F0_LEPSM
MTSESPDAGVESLLVFGYGCRIFDDAEKAVYVDEGRHLIPWNGQSDLRIDRYDGRVHLTDLPPEEGSYPEDEEDKKLCDEERYRSLRIKATEEDEENVDETNSQEKTKGFSYDYSTEESQRPPSKVQQLSLRTLANVIEKTADFIVREGAQMEILMRAKETGNLKFQFLNPGNPYHPIYKQVLEKKRARFKAGGSTNPLPLVQMQLDVEKSLRNITLPSAAPRLSGEAKTSSNTSSSSSYSKLVEKIRESLPPPPPPPQEADTIPTIPPPVTLPEISQADSNAVDVMPPKDKDLMMLIDRTASYVAKNGSDTMSVVRKRSPKEFAFLDGDHSNHTYFQYKVALYKEIIKSRKQSNGVSPSSITKTKTSQSSKLNKDMTSKDAVSIVEQKFPLLKGFFS